MYNDICILIAEEKTINEFGYTVLTETRREVFCKVKSVGMREKYEALTVGLKPELVFELVDYYEYNNEPFVEYNGERYTVIRTYRNSQTIDVTVSRYGNTE